MNKLNISLIFAALLILVVGCKDDDLAPIITFDAAGKGAYPRLITESSKLVNLFDIAGSQYVYSVEFVDLEQGSLVAEYKIDLTYEDNDAENGDNSIGPVELRKFGAGDFSTNSNGFQGIENITITANDLISAAGITEESLSPGDNFDLSVTVTTTDGASFTGGNSSSTVTNTTGAFRGHFDFTMPAGCPSDLTGTFPMTGGSYSYGGCDISAESFSGDIEIIDLGAGVYTFSDWSMGGYSFCYGGVANSSSLQFTEVCAEVFMSGFVDGFGDTWEYPTNELDGNDWIIEYSNTYGEAGRGVITNASGWTFTLR